jgi:hypothetical protein
MLQLANFYVLSFWRLLIKSRLFLNNATRLIVCTTDELYAVARVFPCKVFIFVFWII